MTIDEIIAALRTQSAAAALTAGVAHADDLAPVIYAIAARFCDGVYLVPADNELLFNGLHVLAAARHPGLCDQVIAIARQMDDELDQLFPDHATVSLARLLLSVWHRGADSLFTLIEHADMATDAKWALYDVLARLTFDGRVAREQTAALLGVTNHTIRRLIKTGVLPAVQVVPGAPHQIGAVDLASEPVKTAVARKGRPCRIIDANTLPMFTDT